MLNMIKCSIQVTYGDFLIILVYLKKVLMSENSIDDFFFFAKIVFLINFRRK